MGNRLSFIESEECIVSNDVKSFFSKIKVKWLEYFAQEFEKETSQKISFDNIDIRLPWKTYFRIFNNARNLIEKEEVVNERLHWHPAVDGYAMNTELLEDFTEDPPEGLPDDFTEDEESDGSDAEDDTIIEGSEIVKKQSTALITSQEEDGVTTEDNLTTGRSSTSAVTENNIHPAIGLMKKPKNRAWDPTKVSPIFFGYGSLKVAEIDKINEEKEKALQVAETKAINKIKNARINTLGELELGMKGRETVRLRKIDEVIAKYEITKKKKLEEFEKNKRDLPPMAFPAFKVTWESEYNAGEEAFEAEIAALRDKHKRITTIDQNNYHRRVEELEAFKEAEEQLVPSAERLEEIARIELSKWTDDLTAKCNLLDVARKEYEDLRAELEELKAQSTTSKDLQEIKSMLNVSETEIKVKQREVEDSLDWVENCEVLLNRSSRIRNLQDQLLPLFRLIAGLDRPADCLLVVMLAALSCLTYDSYEKKFSFFFTCYQPQSHSQSQSQTQPVPSPESEESVSSGSTKRGNQQLLFDANFICEVVRTFHDALFRLKYIPFSPNKVEIQNEVMRGFLDFKLSDQNSSLTLYETQIFLRSLYFWSEPICRILQVTKDDNFSTYQRNKMGAFALLSRGYIGPTTCKFRHHYDLIKYYPCMEPEHRQDIHDRAMNLGEYDPLKPDYSKFIIKPKKRGISKVVPLEHGHLSNIKYIRDIILNENAIKIQRVFRGVRERRIAEFAAKSLAFIEAKEIALREMKEKVMQEFRKRESASGVGKMKWDAQVRIRQAKLRTQGQAVSRADTVMIMMEEAIERAKEEILGRFKQMEEAEGYGADAAVEKLRAIQNGYLGPVNDVIGFKIFGVLFRVSAGDQSATDTEAMDRMNSPRGEKRILDVVALASKEEADGIEALGKKRTTDMIHGVYVCDSSLRGESLMHREMRIAMANPEPEARRFQGRLRAIDKTMTELKTYDLLQELPTKRLLIQFVKCLSLEDLIEDLREHFRFEKNASIIGRILKAICESDRENGVAWNQLTALQTRTESSIKLFVHNEAKKEVDGLEELIRRKMSILEDDTPEEDVIISEYDRLNGLVVRYKETLSELLRSNEKTKEKMRKVMMSYLEMNRRKHYIELLKIRKSGESFKPVVTLEHRQNWIVRLHTALRSAETTPEEQQLKYTEIRSVTSDFVEQATRDSMIIIQEFCLPKHRKTIPVSQEEIIDGRSNKCGRGHEDGKTHIFEAHNIIYRVCKDYHGIFNGADEYAFKAAGNDRLGSYHYFKCHFSKVNLPLIVTIDYYGYRVHAMSKLTHEKIAFNDEGEVRKISQELVYGIQNRGNSFLNKNKVINSQFRQAAATLNLSEHNVKGLKDINPIKTFCSAEIRIYRGQDEYFYARDFWRSFPSENHEETQHLPPAPRAQSIFWRLLRPEFCRSYPIALSPDGCCSIVKDTVDERKQYEDIQNATKHLLSVTVPTFINHLCTMDFSLPLSLGLGIDLTSEMHHRGINIRHLGYIRSLIWQELYGTVSLFFNCNYMTTQFDLRDDVRNGFQIKIGGELFTVKETKKKQNYVSYHSYSYDVCWRIL